MSYWEKRIEEQLNQLTEKTERQVRKEIIKAYKVARQEIIYEYLNLYNEVVAEIGIENLKPNDIYRFDSYYRLQNKIGEKLKELGGLEIRVINKKLEELYNEVYTSIPLEERHTADRAFGLLTEAKAENIVKSIWCADGKHWSSRIWDNKALLQQALEEGLSTTILKGEKSSNLKKILMEQFSVSYRMADRIVRTEAAHIETVSAQNRYRDAGIRQVKILVEADACDVCKEMKGKKYPIEMASSLVPRHPNCKCCIVPVIDA